MDKLGHHLTARMPSGRVRARAGPVEMTVAQICREAGGRVRTNVLLKDLNASVAASDERRLEVVASGLSAFGGAQLAIDVTVRSVLRRDGSQRPCADWKDGVTAESVRRDKEAKYPEIAGGSRCRLLVVVVEVGGRFSEETVEFLRQLAASRAQSVQTFLRGSAASAFERRWSRMLAMSVAASHVSSIPLEKDAFVQADHGVRIAPWLQSLLMKDRCSQWAASRA